jgi:transcriptional regulator with XRE-family HTH domain
MVLSTKARGKLRRFVKSHDLHWCQVATALGVSKAVVSQWNAGTARPSHHLRLALERLTAGEIAPGDWLTSDEVAGIEAIRPIGQPATVAA